MLHFFTKRGWLAFMLLSLSFCVSAWVRLRLADLDATQHTRATAIS